MSPKRLIASSVLLAVFSPTWGQITLTAESFGTVVNSVGGTVTFEVLLNRHPDFFTLDSVGRMADQLQFYVDSRLGVNALNSVDDARIWGIDSPGTQSLISFGSIPIDSTLTITEHPSHLVIGSVPYSLLGPDLSFTVPLAMLGDEDGSFSYKFELFEYGAWTGVTYGPIPEPPVTALSGVGLIMLSAAIRWRRKRTGASTAVGSSATNSR